MGRVHVVAFYQFVVIFMSVMAVESRILEPNINLLYGEIDASLSLIRSSVFGFHQGGSLELSIKCPPTVCN